MHEKHTNNLTLWQSFLRGWTQDWRGSACSQVLRVWGYRAGFLSWPGVASVVTPGKSSFSQPQVFT